MNDYLWNFPTTGLALALSRAGRTACRAGHLFLGTKADNNADMRTKRRHRTKLTEAIVKTIRKSAASNTELAIRYGVSRVLIGKIRCGQAWRA